MAYLGKTPSQAVRSRYYFTATGGETSLSGTDDNSNTLTFTDGNYVDVALNGVTLVAGTDYNTTTANTIGALTALVASDVVEVIVYDTFSVFGGNVKGDFDISNGNLIVDTDTLYVNSTNDRVGIGTNSPASELHVKGSAYTPITIDGTSGGTIDFYRNGSRHAQIFTDNAGGDIVFRNNTTTERMRITSSGNVGIGTASPTSELHLHVSGASDGAQIKFDSDYGIGYVGQENNTSNNLIIGSNNAGVTFYSSDTERMRITSAGRLGIGTSSPAQEIHGYSSGGDFSLRLESASATGTAYTYYKNADQEYAVGIRGTASDKFQIIDYTADTTRLAIDTSGNVGIGTSSPSYLLDVTGHARINATSNPTLRFSENGTLRGLITSSSTIGLSLETQGALPLKINTNGAERLRITSAGRLGLGLTSPASQLHIKPSSGDADITLEGASQTVRIDQNSIRTSTNSHLSILTNSTERLRFFNNGRVNIGGSPATALNGFGNEDVSNFFCSGGSAQYVAINSSSANAPLYISLSTSATTSALINFADTGSSVGAITTNGTSTTYSTSSDHRLKENAVAMTGAITRVKSLQPKRFNFIADTTDTLVDGFMAHEAQTVVPEAVTGTHNEVDSDGNAVYQGIDQSKLVPLLTGALQEAITKIETLETEMTALKARVTTLENA